ncbi:hypothetical protein RIF23_15350 [Lipingzhangella sp. LS1_29]|uniref:Uncharacterized protein n=1 Tax=Lipingzhangella rawalii TaxID=2055835 RepID=A0ABU2HA12_9ACTN|nr:hypothetical protein [Lipingzhangella rawalii]MDS1271670.1 hypothetical protein [Lipingzhangella rawalii]
MKLRSVAAASVLTLGGAVFLAAPAHAGLVTYCDGEGGEVTVPGDLVVDEGKSCTLTGTTVQGDVEVRDSANLIVTDGTVNGELSVHDDGLLDAEDTEIAGNVITHSAYGAYLEGSDIGASVESAALPDGYEDGYLYAISSTVGASLNATTGSVYVESSRLGGDLVGDGAEYTDVYDSTVQGQLRVEDTAEGGVFCGGEVYGSATYQDNAGVVQIGASGPVATCTAVSYWDEDVRAQGNTADIYIDNNIIAGDLVAQDNDPVALAGTNNRVRGAMIGDFEDMPTVQTFSIEDRTADIEQQHEQRTTEAESAAEEAGPAF